MKRKYNIKIKDTSIENHKELSLFEKFIDLNRLSNTIPYILGEKGIGKSDRVRNYAKKMGFEFISLEFSNIDRVEFMGLMDLIEYKKGAGNKELDKLLDVMQSEVFSYHKHTVPSWVKKVFENHLKGKVTVLFFDELNRASSDVASALMNTILERKYGSEGLELPESTFILAAGNPDSDSYIVNSLDHALNGRMIKYELETSLSEWMKDFAIPNKIHHSIIDYLNQNKEHFIKKGEEDKNTGEVHPGSDPRRWEMLSNNLYSFETIYKNDKENYLGEIKDFLLSIFGVFLGNHFFQFYINSKKLTLSKLINYIEKDLKENDKSFFEINQTYITQVKRLEGTIRNEFLDNSISKWKEKEISDEVLAIVISLLEAEQISKVLSLGDSDELYEKIIEDVIDKYDNDTPEKYKNKLSFYNELVEITEN